MPLIVLVCDVCRPLQAFMNSVAQSTANVHSFHDESSLMILLITCFVLLQGIMYDHDEMLANAASIPGAETAIFAECCKRNKVRHLFNIHLTYQQIVTSAQPAQHST
jgi:hypothetical protein